MPLGSEGNCRITVFLIKEFSGTVRKKMCWENLSILCKTNFSRLNRNQRLFIRFERKILESTLSLVKSSCDRYDFLFKNVKFLYKFQTLFYVTHTTLFLHYYDFRIFRKSILEYKQRPNRFPFFNERKIRPNKALGEIIKNNCSQEDKISTLAVIERAESDFQNSPRS